MPSAHKVTDTTIYKLDDFKVGDYVRHRTWTVPPGNAPQRPLVHKKIRRITYISQAQGSIYCGITEFKAFELVPA